jgi:hypothetical protein
MATRPNLTGSPPDVNTIGWSPWRLWPRVLLAHVSLLRCRLNRSMQHRRIDLQGCAVCPYITVWPGVGGVGG